MRRTVEELRQVVLDGAAAYPDDAQMAAAARQLRALLAVARYADAERATSGNTHMDTCRCPLCRALDRLSRLSTPKRARKR